MSALAILTKCPLAKCPLAKCHGFCGGIWHGVCIVIRLGLGQQAFKN